MATAKDETLDKDGGAAPASPTSSRDTPPGVRPGNEVVRERPRATWKSYLWDTLDKSPEERRFLFKLDAVLMTFASLGYLIKYLDQVNIVNAFVSGMQEDLGLYSNELNYMIACWTVGYVVGEIPRHVLPLACVFLLSATH